MNSRFHISILLRSACIIFFASCTGTGPSGLFGKKSPHEQYADKLKDAGLEQTALGQQWMQAASKGVNSPVKITIPYSESGYFASDQAKAVGLTFFAKRGEKLLFRLKKNPESGFLVFMDLWQSNENAAPKLLASADTGVSTMEYEIKNNAAHILRLQPELLKSGQYTIEIIAGPSLAFPVTPKVNSNIGSFWGAGRDGGARTHEGIDIFAPKRSALLAAANGRITRVNENNLGGKTVWLQPAGKDYVLYYAHLDEQLVEPGQMVNTGNSIGLVGNTGNAKSTLPHLHFGIYTNDGAIDPFPFVNPKTRVPDRISVPLAPLNNPARTSKATSLLSEPENGSQKLAALAGNSFINIEAATGNYYKVTAPPGVTGFLPASHVELLSKPFQKINVAANQPLYDQPLTNAAHKEQVLKNQTVELLAAYKNFYYVRKGDEYGWITK